MKCLILILALAALSIDSVTANDYQTGGKIFAERCAICHGGDGLGEGFLALAVPDYPNTNLRKDISAADLKSIEAVIRDGGVGDDGSVYSPPWRDELGDDEITVVAKFVLALRESPDSALAALNKDHSASKVAGESGIDAGRLVYKTRCVLCHGESGLGDGKMSKIVKSPPPFNLTLSIAPDAYLKMIVENGGEPLGRSMQMPPWRDELSAGDIQNVITYIKTLRKNAATE